MYLREIGFQMEHVVFPVVDGRIAKFIIVGMLLDLVDQKKDEEPENVNFGPVMFRDHRVSDLG